MIAHNFSMITSLWTANLVAKSSRVQKLLMTKCPELSPVRNHPITAREIPKLFDVMLYCLAVALPSLFSGELLYRVILPPLHTPHGLLEPVCGTARVHVLQM